MRPKPKYPPEFFNRIPTDERDAMSIYYVAMMVLTSTDYPTPETPALYRRAQTMQSIANAFKQMEEMKDETN